MGQPTAGWLLHHEHRQRAVRQHARGFAAQQQCRHASASVRGHHDQIAVLLFGVIEDRLPGMQCLDRVRLAAHTGRAGASPAPP